MPPPRTVQQSGEITAGHFAKWAANGVIEDAGPGGNVTVVLTGDVTGSGTGTIATTIAADVARLDEEDQTLAGGANVTTKALTPGNVTIDCGARPLQSIANNGAFTITAPAADGSCLLMITNGASAGAVSFSGFTVGDAGDVITTTNGHKFTLSIWRIGGVASYKVVALQ